MAAVERAINDADPVGLLETGAPEDEYSPETETIVRRVVKAERIEDVTEVVHAEFVRWFGDETAGLRAAYEALAQQIWQALLEFRRDG